MSNVKLSIIVPIYNVEKYLDRCMQSLLNQTLKEIEIVLVDDGSPDNCPKMCDEYAKKDSRVKVIHKPNAGLGYARNSGLEIATGEYVAFVDSDDYLDVNAYEMSFTYAVKENADYVSFGNKTECNKGEWTEECPSSLSVLTNEEVKKYLLDTIACAPGIKQERKYNMSVWHGLYRRKIIEDHNICFFSEREVICEDILFQIDYLQKARKIVLLPRSYYFYCLNDTSLTGTFKEDKFIKHIKLHDLLIKKIGNSKDEIVRVDRFFIGYVRSYCSNIFRSGRSDYEILLTNVVKHPIWDRIKNRFKGEWLPVYGHIVYCLIINKHVKLLSVFFPLVNLIKSKR